MEHELTFTLRRTPFIMRPDGLVDHSLLQHIANQFNADCSLLADSLNVRRTFKHQANQNAALDVLVRWVKRMPRSSNKVTDL